MWLRISSNLDQAPQQGDHTTRRWVFHCSAPVGAHHIGFTIGPFEQVDFAQFRETGKEDQLKEQAVSVHGFCLPGREEELRNTGIPLQMVSICFHPTLLV